MDEPGLPYIVLHVEAPTSRNGTDGVVECIDFVGATFEEIDEHLKRWGSDVAASRGRADFAGFGGHGNGGKFNMRENFMHSEFVTYRDGRITVFGFDDTKKYGFHERIPVPRYRRATHAPSRTLIRPGQTCQQQCEVLSVKRSGRMSFHHRAWEGVALSGPMESRRGI